ncbi:hypothetical protein QFZ82_006654 [Streptomyces sp. V4I23]|uniref:hypothetical protein n=1 Tax=Streptomyces sp. V4I23 TaxID=3042282 RepID=UPI0027810316|nr:hypothetical protein [Streptomyces sp. V4I23]MDQ1012169.1 hypothetical protein [Streptomyces sp. V4I23]
MSELTHPKTSNVFQGTPALKWRPQDMWHTAGMLGVIVAKHVVGFRILAVLAVLHH